MATYLGRIPGLDIYRNNGCSRCGVDQNLIDTDVNIDYEGGLAFCKGCVGDFAQAAGFSVLDDEVRLLRNELETMKRRALNAESKLKATRAAMRGTKK